MNIKDRFSCMLLKIRVFTAVNYMYEAKVDEKYFKTFVEYVLDLNSKGVHPEAIMQYELPLLPPYRNVIFENKEDCDRFCEKVKNLFGLDYKSKQVNEKRWRVIHVRDDSISV